MPGQDPAWEGDLLELERLLALLGVRSNRLVGHGQGAGAWARAHRARLSLVLSPWGLKPAQALAEVHGVPVLDLGWAPVGSLDAGLLLGELGRALDLPAPAILAVQQQLNDELRYYLGKAAPGLLLGNVQKRVAVVGGSSGAVGQARFLAGTLGQLVTEVVITDEPPEAVRDPLKQAIQALAPGCVVSFLAGRAAIQEQLLGAGPELIIGSALEATVARDLGAALVERAAPLRARPLIRRSHVGLDGAIALVEDLLAALIPHPEARPRAVLATPLTQETTA